MKKPLIGEDGEVRELTEENFFSNAARGRPPMLPGERKVKVTTFLDPDVVDFFKRGGRGWQTRVNQALRDFVESQR